MRRTFLLVASALALVLGATASSAATTTAPDHSVNVTAGSPVTPFSQNKQNEPTVAINANSPNIVVAGSNDEIDEEACNAGDPTTCPFTAGVGVSGFYYSADSGHTWSQPTYSGWTARNCLGTPTGDTGCQAQVGMIGTIPGYYEAGLVSDGDPALAFGPKPSANGSFSWANGSRLYYANLTSNFPGKRTFDGFEAIGVSRTDNAALAAAGGVAGQAAWMAPVIASVQAGTTFSDKEQIWADNAASSPFFGNVYVCWANFKSNSLHGAPAPLLVAASSDGGATWTQHPISAAANNSRVNPMDGCTIRTDSAGNAYVFGVGTDSAAGHLPFEFMSVSSDGGQKWSKQTPVVGPVSQPGIVDPGLGRPTIDGIGGARSDLAPAPSVDIANSAPTGAGATNRIVMSYVSGEITKPHVYFTESTDQGATWSNPRVVETGSSDRGYYSAPAISPDGKNVYVVYNAFTTKYQPDTSQPRALVGVFLHATVSGSGPTGAFAEVNRGTAGDPRGSSQNGLTAEFLGDYVYAAATNTYGTGVWNDARNAADCPAVDAWRIAFRAGSKAPSPAVQQDCLASFGNSDIYGVTVAS